MDKLTEANAVVEPKRRVSSDTATTGSLTLDHLLSPILEPARTNAGHRGVPLHSGAFYEMADFIVDYSLARHEFSSDLHISALLTQNTRRMSIFEPAPSPWPSRMLAVFRIVAGLVFMTAGTMIVFGQPKGPVPMPPFSLTSQTGIGGILELLGGLAIVLGLFTRPVAFVLAGEMAVAYFQFHAPQSFFPTVNEGVPAVMYCFFFLDLTLPGPGAWSIDSMLARRAGCRHVAEIAQVEDFH